MDVKRSASCDRTILSGPLRENEMMAGAANEADRGIKKN